MTALRRAAVRVPCSTSNLGSGFDTIGLALDRYLQVTFEPDDEGGLRVERGGTLPPLSEKLGPDLVAETFTAELAKVGTEPSGLLTLVSEIPIARGLGGSAAAILAGYDLARAVRGEARDDDAAFRAALRHEGHGDNAAPSLFGGLRAVASTPDGPVVVQLHLSPAVGFAYAAPPGGVTTREAREILPSHVPHSVAAATLGRLAALIRGLAEGHPDLIRLGVKDELHMPYRVPLIPGSMAAMTAATEAGAWAVTVSGAGSGLIAMCHPDDAEVVADAMYDVFDAGANDPESFGFAVRPATAGLERIGD